MIGVASLGKRYTAKSSPSVAPETGVRLKTDARDWCSVMSTPSWPLEPMLLTTSLRPPVAASGSSVSVA